MLASISIDSPTDLQSYYSSQDNSYTIDAGKDDVTISAGVTIGSASGTSSISISGGSITIGEDVQLLASGDITLEAENVMKGFNISAVNQAEDIVRWFEDQDATISIGENSTIEGGTITISASSGNEMVGEQIWSLIQPIAPVLLEALHTPDPLTFPVSVQVWTPASTITLSENVEVDGSEKVAITATAQANALGKAIWNSLKKTGENTTGKSPLGFAVGEFYNDASAQVTVATGAGIKTEGEVEVKTSVDNKTELEAKALKNLGITQTNPKATSLAWGSTQVKSTSIVTLAEGSLIHADGSVSIEAEAKDENSVNTEAATYRDGLVSIGGAYAYSYADVQVIANGKIESGASVETAVDADPVIFNPAFSVDFETDTLNLPEAVAYTTGQAVVFDSAGGSTIPGLVPGNIYYAIIPEGTSDQLQLASSVEDAVAGNAISFGAGYPTLETMSQEQIPITVVDSFVTNTVLFSFDTGCGGSMPETPIFSDGDMVTYTPVEGQSIGTSDAQGNWLGALAAGHYTVSCTPEVASPDPDLFPSAIQLLDTQGDVIVLNTNSYFTTTDSESNSVVYQIASIDTGSNQVDFNFPESSDTEDGQLTLMPTPVQDVNLVNGQEIIFHAGLGNQISNLIDGETYYAVVDPATPGVIRLAETSAQSTAANPAVQSAVPFFKTEEYQAAIAIGTDSFSHSNASSTLDPQSDGSYQLWNDADGGTFTLAVTLPTGQIVSTEALSWQISSAELQAVLNSLSGIISSVNGTGTSSDPWGIEVQYSFDVGTIEESGNIAFGDYPSLGTLAEGTPLQYLGVTDSEGAIAKPIGGLTSGNTYYASTVENPDFNPDLPQYLLGLRATTDASAPMIDVFIEQTMTGTDSTVYSFAYTDVQGSEIALNLPSQVTFEVDGASLSGGTASTETVPPGSLSLFSFATSGTFTLTVTDPAGDTATTGNIAYNAVGPSSSVGTDPYSSIQDALSAVGVAASVTGLGTLASPWTIQGLGGQTLTADSSNLANDGDPTTMFLDVLQGNVQQVWTDATDGSVIIELSVAGQSLPTASVPFDATNLEVAETLNGISHVQATVTGAGTASNPWQITAWYESIQTGDPLVFQDAWNSYNLGMLNGDTYYAVVSDQQFPNGSISLQLATTQAKALGSEADVNMLDYLLLDQGKEGIMAGSRMGVDDVPSEASGITLKASLDANDSASMLSDVGQFAMLGYYLNLGKDEGSGADYVSGVEKKIEEAIPKKTIEIGTVVFDTVDLDDSTSWLETSLALALLESTNKVQVTVGSTAVIDTSGSVTISSDLSHVLHTSTSASVARKTGAKDATTGNSAVAVALDFAFVDNTSQAVILPNAQVTGSAGVSIDSSVTYPFAWKQTEIAALKEGGLTADEKALDGIALAENVVKTAMFSNAFGVSNWLFNHSVDSAILESTGEAAIQYALVGSVIYTDITTNNLAQICDGAQINQSGLYPASEEQPLDISAVTTVNQVSAAGQMAFGLNLGWLIYAAKSKQPNNLLNLNTSKNLLGGSFNFTEMNHTTQALIGGAAVDTTQNSVTPAGPTRISFGQDGITLEATTDNEFIPLAQSGGKDQGIGVQASVARVGVESQETKAAVVYDSGSAAPVIDSNEDTNGKISISAKDDTVLTPSAGGILVGKAINIGFSSAEATLNRNVSAFVGASDPQASGASSAGPRITASGDISIEATASGKVIPVSVAGSVITKDRKEPDGNGENKVDVGDQEFKFGLGISGDYSDAKITDSVSAYVNQAMLTGNANTQTIELLATNDTRLNIATGAAAFQSEKGSDSSAGLSGAASYAEYTSDVSSVIANAEITLFEVTVQAENDKTIGAFSAGGSGDYVSNVGIAVAGSVSLNHITNTTVAKLSSVTGHDLGEMEVQALETDDVWAAAGTITFITSIGSDAELEEDKPKTKVGVGLGVAQNQLNSTTQAIIGSASQGAGSQITQQDGNVEVSAEQASRSFALAAGVVLVAARGAGVSAYGMGASNKYESAAVEALVQDGSTLTSTATGEDAGVTVSASFIPIMITTAGDLGLDASYKTGLGNDVSVGAGASVSEVEIKDGQVTAAVTESTIQLEQGDLQVTAFVGQAEDYTDLDNTMEDLNLPPGDYNLYSLAIAGGVSLDIEPEGELALGVDGVGAGIGSSTEIDVAASVNDSSITLNDGKLSVTATDNLAIYNDAGGASVSFQLAANTAIGIVAGIGAGVHASVNTIAAGITDSTLAVTGGLDVEAKADGSVNGIGFGVAVDTSIASSVAVGFASSAGVADVTLRNALNASIAGGSVNSSGAVMVSAVDQSTVATGVGSGSLAAAIGGGTGVALAAGASVSRIDADNTISSTIGSAEANPADATEVSSTGAVTVFAENKQTLTSTAIAVASSLAIGGGAAVGVAAAGAGARIKSGNKVSAQVINGASVTSTLTPSVENPSAEAVTVKATDAATMNAVVGSGAVDISISPDGAMFGGSLGISIAEITNDDVVRAVVENSTITTYGSGVVVEAGGENVHTSESVATSLTIAIGIAGAGGNSNIYDNAEFTAEVGAGSLIVTGDADGNYGSLSVLALTRNTTTAEIFGGSGSVGSVGVFMSDAERNGSTNASLQTAESLDVGDLIIAAKTAVDTENPKQAITSEGMSVTVGVLAGTGEHHFVTVSESVTTTVSGSSDSENEKVHWTVNGDLTVQAIPKYAATAKTSGAGQDQQDVSVSVLGVGFFKVNSTVTPTVELEVKDVTLDVSGSSVFETNLDSGNTTEARSGSGSLVGGDAAKATSVNSPKVALTTEGLNLTTQKASFRNVVLGVYNTNANSVYATAVGGSTATATNTSEPQVGLNLNQGTVISAKGSVLIESDVAFAGIGGGDSIESSGFMARVGGGGIVSGFGGEVDTTFSLAGWDGDDSNDQSGDTVAQAAISVGDEVEITAMQGGNILVGSSARWVTDQLTHMGTGGLVDGAGVNSYLASTLANEIELGSGANFLAPEGRIGIGTSTNSVTTSDSDSYTFGIAGGSSSDASNTMTSDQSVLINEDASLQAGRDIVVTAGQNPLTQEKSLLDIYAIVTARCAGLFEFPGASHTSDLTASASVEIDTGSSIISDLDVEIGAIPGINNATWYTLKVWNGLQTDIDSDAGTVTETGLATIDGSIVAGNASTLDVSISEDKSWTINGSQPSFNLDDQAGLVTLSPQSFDDPGGTPPTPFLPFKAGYNSAYEPQQLLNGLDETSKALLAPDISTETVDSITLAGLTAVGGQVVINAKELAGAATISANVPEITVTNDSDAYLLLDGMGIPNTLNVGQVNFRGGAQPPAGMQVNPETKQSAISIKQNYDQDILGSAAGPAIALNDAIFNTAGSVTIDNAEGAFVQKAPINALLVSIDTPNSAYIVSTPEKYFGTSGSIADSFTKSNSVNVLDGSFESTSTTDSPNYIYRPASTDWTFIGDSGVSANGTGFTSANPDAPFGTQVAFVQETGVIKQAVGGLINGRGYELQFDAARRANYSEPTLQVSMGSTVIATISVDETAYDRYSYPVPTQQPEGTDTLMLTDGFGSTASANWHVEPIAIPDSGTFTVEFTYQASGDKAAGGIALVFQQEGVEAVGGIGSDLGYVGIVGPTTAYQMNLYDDGGTHIPGTNFVTGNTSGNYNTTGEISLTSGNPIRVELVFDADASTITETLTDTSDLALTPYTHVYPNVDLGVILGTQAYLGFTGADGGVNSVQEVSGFSLTMGEDNLLEGFDGWSIAGTRFLAFSGIDPDGTDQTVFLDGVTIVDNPNLFTPGLVPAAVSYDANHAATTAANILYGKMSGETTSAAFSHWLYNTGGISIDDFENTDQIWPSVGGDYPSKAKDNWNSRENGSGIIFFGSEIPYLYNALTTVSSGSELLNQGYLGYLDTNTNASTYSQAASASGNSYTTYLNVTQGTGPENTSGDDGRGFFPTVPYSDSTGRDFPSSAVITDPQANSLGGSGITAGSLDVNALYLDINGPVDIGSIQQDLSVELSANLQSAAEAYQLDYESGAESSPNMPLDSYLGSSGLTGYYDAQTDQIVIDPYSVNGGTTTAVFRGQIISTTQFGKITLHSNPGDLEIDNQTDLPLVLQGITASTDEVMGSVTFHDTLTGTSTTYLYQADDQVSIYQGELDADLDDMTLFAAADGDSVAYDPAPNLAYQWKQDAYISRKLQFVNTDESYDLAEADDNWGWGPLPSVGEIPDPNQTMSTSPFKLQHDAPTTLYLTEGAFNTATAVWYQEPISIPSTGNITIEFDYTASGNRSADGITFAFQTEGIQAIGNAGGYLGYEGIAGPTAAYQINIYDCCDPVIPGSNFVTTNTTQNYIPTGDVEFQSGNRINVQLVYDASANTVTENLTDNAENTSYARTYPDIDLASVFGSDQVYVGFTGADGGGKSIQTVSNFSLDLSDGNVQTGFGGWGASSQGQGSVLQLDAPITDFSEVATAIITELETATTKFDSDNEDAWNYGPSTQWDWTYPTEILLRINNQIPASNSISMDFSNVKYGSLAVTSQSELQLEGNVVFPGSVTLSALNDITQADGAVVRAQQVDFVSTSGSVGVAGGPVQIDLDPSLPVDATAFQSIYLSSSDDFVVGQIDASVGNSQRPLGNVELHSQGDFIAGSTEAEITGSSIDLQAKSGSIGSQSAPLTIQAQAFQIDTGSLVEGLLTAAAKDSIFLVQPRGELRVHSVTTSSPQGVVSLVNQDGDITSGSTRDLFGFGGKKFTSAQITLIDEAIKVRDFVLDSGSLTIAAFEGSVQSNYLQYWTLVGLTPTTQLGSYDQQAGEFVLNSNGLAYYQTQADLYYTAVAADQSPVTATSVQVQAYGNLIYSNAVSVFASDLAFGPEWSSLDQFGAYDETYEFAASSQTVSELTHDVDELAQSFSLLSFDAFQMSERGYGGTGSQPAIQTTVLSLSANGSIGALSDPVEITLANMEAGPITSSEQRLLAQATSAGEIKMVGENVDGSRVVYSYDDAPVNVTPVAALIRIDSPLYVDIASEGLVMVDAAGPVNLSETAGDLNLLDIQTLDMAQLIAQNNINQVQLQETSQTTGWSISGDGTLGYVSDDLEYEATDFTLNNREFATGVIANGSFEEPVQLSESFTYNPASTTWVYSSGNTGVSGNNSGFTNGNPVAPFGSQVGLIQQQGVISQSFQGLVLGQPYELHFDMAQRANYPEPTFTVGLDGDVLTTQTPSSINYESVSVPFTLDDTLLQLTDGGNNEATAYWYQNPVNLPVTGGFTVEFTYQSGGDKAADGITFAFQNEGIDALGGVGGSLGYVGIGGPTAAYQINLYSGHVQGSNFVVDNTSEDYLSTGEVSFDSGNPIQVQLVFDADQQTVTETLTDTVLLTTFTRTYTGIDLATVLGRHAYVGFTGGDGGASSTQTVTDFSLWSESQSTSPIMSGFGNWGCTGENTLTFTGVDPSDADQTAFLDGIAITRSPGIVSGKLNLVSGGGLGEQSNPLNVQVGGHLDVYAVNDLYLSHQASNDLRLNEIYTGGNANIAAPSANIFAVTNQLKGSVAGFGANGSGEGWSTNSTNGSEVFSEDTLTLGNEAKPVGAASDWKSVSEAWYDTAVTVDRDFVASFVYQSQSPIATLGFNIVPSGTPVNVGMQVLQDVSFVIDKECQDCDESQMVGLYYAGAGGGELLNQLPGSIGLDVGNPIHVLMVYDVRSSVIAFTLTDTVTGNTHAFDSVYGTIQALGTNQARLGFTALGNGQAASQEITGFSFSYGAPTIKSNNLSITSGKQIGAPSVPVLVLATGEIQADAPDGIYLTQVNGDLFVDSVASESDIQLSALTGSIGTAGSANPADSSLLLGTQGNAESESVPTIQADQLQLRSLHHIGAGDINLEIGASSLAASTVVGDINLAQSGNLSVDGAMRAGGAIRLTGDSHLTVSSPIHAAQEVNLKSNGGSGSLHLLPNAHVASANRSVNLFADAAVFAELGAHLENAESLSIATGAAALAPGNLHRIRLLGAISGGPLQLSSGSEDDSVEVAITDLTGVGGNPLEVMISQLGTLHLDDTRSSTGRSYTAVQGRINTDVAELQLGEVRSVVMNLGSGDDSFQSQGETALTSLEMHGNGGNDQFDMAAVRGEAAFAVSIVGGEHEDQLSVDGLGTPVWMVNGAVHAGNLHVDHGDIEKLFLQNALDGLSAEQTEKLEFAVSSFPEDRLLLLGTAGEDDWFVGLNASGIQVDGVWNGTEHLRHRFDAVNYREVVFELLAGDDSLLVNGIASHQVIVDGAKGNDWISVDESDAMITDLQGNNFITTGAGSDEIRTGSGRDKINTGDGQNVIHDAGGMNWIVTGMHDDTIHHENNDDFVSASDGINKIWLNGELQGWHNASMPTDVNLDARTSPLDVLLIINRLAIVDFAGGDGRYFFPGSADSLDSLYDANGDGYMSTLDCVIVLNELGEAVDGGEGEMPLDFVPREVVTPNNAANEKSDAKSDECFAHWDELLPLLITPPQSHRDFLQAWEQEDLRRKRQLESVIADLAQAGEEETQLKSLQARLI